MEMPCFDGAGRSDSDEGRGFRRRKFSSDPLCCPVCGVTVRHGELQTHFARELDCLLKLSSSNRGRRQSLDAFRALNNSTALQSQKIQINVTPEDRWNTFQKIKTNRQGRLHTKSRRHKGNESICPVCTNNVQGSIEDLKSHVEMCLRKQNGEPCDDEFVDVEGDSEMFEEYEWAGQQRVRASTLLEGGFAATGMATCSSHSNATEEDVDIVVDGDDCATYGPAQYSERDIVSGN
uniref:(California timema) hypothetical protein n=1 Tax=Timema californicum TaxID=61474 RepID=A0A7R9J8P1_TIMCA|nr:unnamed protein product [Timema californicum]